MKTTATHFTTMLMAVLLLVSCKTAQEIMETGDYDRAISESIKKIRGKKKKRKTSSWSLNKLSTLQQSATWIA